MDVRSHRTLAFLIWSGLIGLSVACGAPAPTESPESNVTPSAPPSVRSLSERGWELVTREEAGFEVLLPGTWELTDIDPFVLMASAPGQVLTIRAGDAENELHLLSRFAPGQEAAVTMEDLQRIITDSFRDLWELESAIDVEERPYELAGSPAEWFSLSTTEETMGPAQQENVIAFSGDRPYAISWQGHPESVPFDELLAGFRFLGSTVSSEASEADSLVYTMEEGAYEVSVPEAWRVRSDLFGDGGFFAADPSLPVAGWGLAFESPHTALMTISVGDSQGRIRLCQAGGCFHTYEVGTTIEEMDAAIDSMTQPEGFPTMTESRRDGSLGGEPALFVGITSPHGWTATPQFRHVFAVHEGRPVVVAFEHWALMNAPGDEHIGWLHVVDTFRFLD
jgi:hypothetical protein